MERDSYPIPSMDEYIASSGKAQMFATAGASFGYWQIDIDDKDIDKTVLVTHIGLFCYTRMLLNLEKRSATFQRAVNDNLASVKGQLANVYIGDILIFFQSPQLHLSHIEEVLKLVLSAV